MFIIDGKNSDFPIKNSDFPIDGQKILVFRFRGSVVPWFASHGEVQSKTKATDPRAKSRSLCRVSTQHGGWHGWQVPKCWWNIIDGTSMEHHWRWNIYGLALENWMKTGDEFHGVGIIGIGLMWGCLKSSNVRSNFHRDSGAPQFLEIRRNESIEMILRCCFSRRLELFCLAWIHDTTWYNNKSGCWFGTMHQPQHFEYRNIYGEIK